MAERRLQAVGDDWTWGTESAAEAADDYSPDEFYVRGTNKHDHSVVSSVRLDPTIAGQLDSIIAARTIPHYKTRSDLIRDAVVHRLHYLSNQMGVDEDGELRELLAIEREQARMEQARSRMVEMENMIQTATANINDAKVRGDGHWMEQTRAGLQRQLETIREPYRTRVEQLLKSI